MKTRGNAWMGSSVFWSMFFSGAMLAGVSGTANASSTVVCDYDTATPQTLGSWTDVRRGIEISMTNSIAGHPCTLTFQGSTGSAGDMWITIKHAAGTHRCWDVEGNILIKRFDNRKGVGFVTHYDEDTKTGLFFGVYDAGNTDAMTISAFDGATGQIKTPPLATKALGSQIKENVWYELEVDTCDGDVPGTFDVTMTVNPQGEDSECGQKPETCIQYSGSLPPGIVAVGAAGVAGQAKSAFVDSQVQVTLMEGSDPI